MNIVNKIVEIFKKKKKSNIVDKVVYISPKNSQDNVPIYLGYLAKIKNKVGILSEVRKYKQDRYIVVLMTGENTTSTFIIENLIDIEYVSFGKNIVKECKKRYLRIL